jgi:hypothetical protein
VPLEREGREGKESLGWARTGGSSTSADGNGTPRGEGRGGRRGLSTSMEGPGGRERRGWVPAHKRQAAVCQATVAHAGGRDEGGSGGGGVRERARDITTVWVWSLRGATAEAGAGEPNRSQGERREHNGERGTAGYGAVWIGGGSGGGYAVGPSDSRNGRETGGERGVMRHVEGTGVKKWEPQRKQKWRRRPDEH